MRNVLHIIASVLLWCLFGYYWLVVSRRQINTASLEAVLILLGIMAAGLVLTLWWIAHNKKLARRNRRNTPPPTVPENFDEDFLGRPLDRPEVAALKTARVVEIDLRPGNRDREGTQRKVYAIVGRDDL